MDGLAHLASAPNQKAVDDLFTQAFDNRGKAVTGGERKAVQELLGLNAQQAQEIGTQNVDF